MSTSEAIVRRYYEAFDKGDYEVYGELFTSDCLIEAPGFSARGLQAARDFDRIYKGAFPSARIESLRMTTKGTLIAAANWLHGGKHEGVLHSPGGDIPPTGVDFSAPYCATFRVENGRISLQRLHFDAQTIPTLLGVA